ncbi:uncharacterized protein RJT20DRAFT_17466 [Scheffersomyces xylosifermentans]|uniref:uncharacterized protein n=1 Tax=Scheffersomyces xylosifermentans TaxID=1304137 RepID=UPI00315DACAB
MNYRGLTCPECPHTPFYASNNQKSLVYLKLVSFECIPYFLHQLVLAQGAATAVFQERSTITAEVTICRLICSVLGRTAGPRHQGTVHCHFSLYPLPHSTSATSFLHNPSNPLSSAWKITVFFKIRRTNFFWYQMGHRAHSFRIRAGGWAVYRVPSKCHRDTRPGRCCWYCRRYACSSSGSCLSSGAMKSANKNYSFCVTGVKKSFF